MRIKVKATIVALCFLIGMTVFFATWQLKPESAVDRDVLFQLAAFNTFSQGNYDGTMSYNDLSKKGDFGIGTFDGLNGEMIALNGVFYQIPSDGTPKVASTTQTAPYATVTFFEVDQTFSVSSLNYTQLKDFLDEQLTSKDTIYAVKVTGIFDWAQTRSPQRQIAPYSNITEALKTQAIFSLSNVSASAVGFWFPLSLDGVDYAGYHLHLITANHAAGGHLLDCIIRNATVEIDRMNRYELVLP